MRIRWEIAKIRSTAGLEPGRLLLGSRLGPSATDGLGGAQLLLACGLSVVHICETICCPRLESKSWKVRVLLESEISSVFNPDFVYPKYTITGT